MTEENDGPEVDDVRRLLAEARHTGPMPAEVAARLDAVLADLASTPADGPTTADPAVASLAAHRRRRAAGLLVAAAVIVVGGVAVAQQLPQRHGSPSAATGAGPTEDAQSRSTGTAPAKQPPGVGSQTLGPAQLDHGRLVVHAKQFSADALAGRDLTYTKFAYGAHADKVGKSCIVAPAHSRLLKAVFHRAPAVLVYHRPAGSTQVVDLFVCGSEQPLRSVTLPTG